MKFLFLVSSSIRHFHEKDFSAYGEQERFQQTLRTIECIREKAPNSYVLLIECSSSPIDKKQKDSLKDLCDLFLEIYNEPGMVQIYENLEKRPKAFTYGKSLLETRGLLNALYTVQEHNLFSDSQRIFKMTGRYLLNEGFEITDYESKFLEDKYVIKKYDYPLRGQGGIEEKESENVYSYLYGAKGAMITGLWSFDRMLFGSAVKALEDSFTYLEKMIQYTSGTDIEHALYRFISHNNVLGVANLGLTVIKGMNGDNGGSFKV